MPIYEYLCGRCGEEFEVLVLASSQKSSCPECGGADLRKKFSVFGMKSGAAESSSSGSSCGGCSSHNCGGCRH